MSPAFDWTQLLQIPVVLGIVWLISIPLSSYMARVALLQPTVMDGYMSPIANRFYKALGINPEFEHRWQTYALSAVSLNLVGVLFLLVLQMTQGFMTALPNVGFLQAFNSAISFATNTDWQSYIPESSMSNLVQMTGITVQMFISAGTGMAVALAFTRSFLERKAPARTSLTKSQVQPDGTKTLGNFWVDSTRMILWVLLPLSILLALIFMAFGMLQTFGEAIASQEAIKLLGTNGAGFFNANNAHPFENPSVYTNLIEIGAMLLIAFSFPQTFGKMIGDPRQGKALLKAMLILFIFAITLALFAQHDVIQKLGPILEGTETRFGWVGTVFFNVMATTTGTGATSAALSSFPPLTGLEILSNVLSGSVVFGAVGSGLYLMILHALLAVFLAGLMVGRTPEYLGKKIESFEMKMVVVAIMLPAFTVLILTALAVLFAPGGPLNSGPHGLTEILYTYASTTYNNGSSFAGLKADMPFYQVTTSMAMVIGRSIVMVAVLALAGSFAQKPKIPESIATFPTTGALFIGLLIAVVIVTSILIFFPAFSLAPLAEQVSPWNNLLPQ